MLFLTLLLGHTFGLGFDDFGNDKLLAVVEIISGVVGLMYGRISCKTQTKAILLKIFVSKNVFKK